MGSVSLASFGAPADPGRWPLVAVAVLLLLAVVVV